MIRNGTTCKVLNMPRYFIQNRDIAYRVVDGEAVLVDPDNAYVRVLNETGSFIWKLCRRKRGIDDLAREISGKFDVKRTDAKTDVSKFLSDMKKRGMIREIRA